MCQGCHSWVEPVRIIGLVQLNFDFAGHGALSHPNILECAHTTKWKQISNLTAFIQGQNESDLIKGQTLCYSFMKLNEVLELHSSFKPIVPALHCTAPHRGDRWTSESLRLID